MLKPVFPLVQRSRGRRYVFATLEFLILIVACILGLLLVGLIPLPVLLVTAFFVFDFIALAGACYGADRLAGSLRARGWWG